LRIHKTTEMTTTALRIDLMVACIGMKRFTSHRTTPTTIKISTSWTSGMTSTFRTFGQRLSSVRCWSTLLGSNRVRRMFLRHKRMMDAQCDCMCPLYVKGANVSPSDAKMKALE